ncbi:MAG: hypothetical protein U0326_22490 [Polyangiales bacterium]
MNLPPGAITGTVTLSGAALPRTLPAAQVPGYSQSSLYLVAHDTGVRHLISSPSYSYGSTSYVLVTNSDTST